MKVQKSTIILTLTLFALTNTMATNLKNPMVFFECRPFTQFTKTIQTELQLTDKQFEELMTLNRKYWSARKEILNTPNNIGHNTALLACWDKWQLELSNHLTSTQKEKFMQWQSQVDLLSDLPY